MRPATLNAYVNQHNRKMIDITAIEKLSVFFEIKDISEIIEYKIITTEVEDSKTLVSVCEYLMIKKKIDNALKEASKVSGLSKYISEPNK